MVKRFLGWQRLQELNAALHEQRHIVYPEHQRVSHRMMLCAVCISLIPGVFPYLNDYVTDIDLLTTLVGIATCLAIVFRVSVGLATRSVPNWRQALRLTHTAFALGCIPVLILFLIAPPTADLGIHGANASAKPGIPTTDILFVLKVAVWAGLTEEFIFRGMLLSACRRWKGLREQRHRDLLGVLLSSFAFSLAHLHTWGPVMSTVLFGVGVGFGAAYLAIGEYLLPLIAYHILFDIVSLGVTLFQMQ